MKKFLLISCLVTLFIGKTLAQPAVNVVQFATGFVEGITDIRSAGDSRLFVVEKLGYISIVDTLGNVNPRFFLNIHSKVTPTTFSAGSEQGLLGLAFSPNYATDGYLYVNYTNKTGVGNTVIARYHVSADPDSVDVASEQILLNVVQPFSNHNGGSLQFGADGYLYIGLGDGGSGGDPGDRAQNTNEFLGKILRIDVAGGGAYSIPPTNPFALSGGAPEVWAYGIRNPWRISFDRQTHDLWIADVGQNVWEEIDFQSATSTGGENYGWRCYEGNHSYNSAGCGPMASYVSPVHEYSHSVTSGCSVTGGFVYRGTQHPALMGYYFFSDYCNGKIYWLLSPGFTSGTAGTFSGMNFTTFGEDVNGELYVGNQTNGVVYRIVSNGVSVEEVNGIVNSFSTNPNPSNGEFTCDLEMSTQVNSVVTITDITGRICFQESRNFEAGHNSFPVDMRTAPAGIYLVKITTPVGDVFRRLEIFN